MKSTSLFRPSSSQRWMECHGSTFFEVDDPPANKYAIQGTAAHAVLEECIKRGIEPSEMLHKSIPVVCDSTQVTTHYKVTEEMVENLEFTLNNVVDEVDKYINMDYDLESEVRLDHPVIKDFGGTVDVLLTSGEFATIMDLKYGTSPVKPNSTQMASYAMLLKRVRPVVKYVKTVIIQPRCRLKTKVSSYNWRECELDDFEHNVKYAMRKAKEVTLVNLDDNLKTGKHCWYCPARTVCPAKALESANKDFGN